MFFGKSSAFSKPFFVIPAKAGHVVTRSEASALTISAIQSAGGSSLPESFGGFDVHFFQSPLLLRAISLFLDYAIVLL